MMTKKSPGSRRRDILLAAASAMLPRTAWAQTGAPPLATVGARREGGALGAFFVKTGHLMYSSRHPEQLQDPVTWLGPPTKAGTVAGEIAFGEVLLVVPYSATPVIGHDHASALATKELVIYVSNAVARCDGDIAQWVQEQGGIGLSAKIVRAFNAIGYARLTEQTHRSGDPVGVPIAGDDPKAVALAGSLIREVGFVRAVVGGLDMGKYVAVGPPLAGEHTPAEIRQIAAGLH